MLSQNSLLFAPISNISFSPRWPLIQMNADWGVFMNDCWSTEDDEWKWAFLLTGLHLVASQRFCCQTAQWWIEVWNYYTWPTFGNVASGRSSTVTVWMLWAFLRDFIAFCPFSCHTWGHLRDATGRPGQSLAFVSSYVQCWWLRCRAERSFLRAGKTE